MTALALALGAAGSSGLGRGDHLTDAAVGVACEQRPNVLSHPRSSDRLRHAIRVARFGELEDQDDVPLVDLRDARRKCAGTDSKLDPLLQHLDGRSADWVTQSKMVDDEMHVPANLSRLRRWHRLI